MHIPPYIWHIEGEAPGPNVVVLGGVHGDEKVGIEVIRRLLDGFGLTDCGSGKTYVGKGIFGNLFLGFGNPEAIGRGTRASGAGPDLNRSFQTEELNAAPSPSDPYDLFRARELSVLFRQTDFLFDIHNTYSPSEPFVCMGNDSAHHRELYELLPVRYVLTDPDSILPMDVGKRELGTTDSFVNSFGGSEWSIGKYGQRKGAAFAYESGSQDDFGKVDTVLGAIHSLFGKVGVRQGFRESIRPYPQQEVYRISDIIRSRESGRFSFVDDGIREGWVDVRKGSKIGSYRVSGKAEFMPRDGKLLFQKKTQDIRAGESICYIVTRVSA